MSPDEPNKTFVNILAFHKIQKRFSWGPNNYAPRRFANLLEFLIAKGYNFVSLNEVIAHPTSDKIALTFDDGYAHLLKQMPEFIEKYKIEPTLFIPSFYIGKKNRWDYNYHFQKCPHLDSSQIKELSQAGVEFGSHGHTHTSLLKLSVKQIEDELIQSKMILEDILGKTIEIISYPFGRFNSDTIYLAKKNGYQYGLTMNFPDLKDDDFNLGRYAVYGYDTNRTVLSKLRRGSLFFVEKSKAKLTNKLSGGTILLNRLRKL